MKTGVLTRYTAILLVVEALLLFVPIIILGAAIEWPASLDEPAAVMLPRLEQEASAVTLGYAVYLGYSVLFWPVAWLTTQVIAGNRPLSPWLKLAAGFATLSALARTIGIIRWLAPMPLLAERYGLADAPEQANIALVYEMLNSYGGAIGEQLGVSLFAALWLTLVSIFILHNGGLPRWIGVFGLVAALSLYANLLEWAGFDLGALITVSTSLIQFWFLAAGISLLIQRPALPQQATTAA